MENFHSVDSNFSCRCENLEDKMRDSHLFNCHFTDDPIAGVKNVYEIEYNNKVKIKKPKQKQNTKKKQILER